MLVRTARWPSSQFNAPFNIALRNFSDAEQKSRVPARVCIEPSADDLNTCHAHHHKPLLLLPRTKEESALSSLPPFKCSAAAAATTARTYRQVGKMSPSNVRAQAANNYSAQNLFFNALFVGFFARLKKRKTFR